MHNRKEVTRRFTGCLAKQTYHNYHLLLIDDGSTDGTAAMVRAQIPSLTVITGTGNWWWGGSLHQGYLWLRKNAASPTDIVLIINDDNEFDPDFLEKAVEALRSRPKTFLLSECFGRKTGQWIEAGIHVDWKQFTFEHASAGKPMNCMSTRGLFFRVEAFSIVGGFHPLLLPHYLSDYEFTYRAGQKGITLATDPSVRVRLDESTTGYNRVEDASLLGRLKKVFSRRSAINPLTLSMFVALACPWQWKLMCWLRITWLSLSNGWKLLTGKTGGGSSR
ncbi:MAG: glycosyltransferase [Nitrospirae bacterium]|nr:glycosyltransferase [Nitrospirota bacterium]